MCQVFNTCDRSWCFKSWEDVNTSYCDLVLKHSATCKLQGKKTYIWCSQVLIVYFKGNRLCQKREIARSLPLRGDMLDLLYKMNTKWARKVLWKEFSSLPFPSIFCPSPPLHCWREKLSFTSSPILSSLIKMAPTKIQIMTGWQGPFSDLNYSLPKRQASQQIDAYHAAYH